MERPCPPPSDLPLKINVNHSIRTAERCGFCHLKRGLEELCPNQSVMCITRVDLEKHTVHLTVGGYPVTAICTPENNPDVFESIQHILIGSLLERAEQITGRNSTKFDKSQEL